MASLSDAAVSFDEAIAELCPAIGRYFALRDAGCVGLVFSRDCWTAIIAYADPRRRHCADVLRRQYAEIILPVRRREMSFAQMFGIETCDNYLIKHNGWEIYVQTEVYMYRYDSRRQLLDKKPLNGTWYTQFDCSCDLAAQTHGESCEGFNGEDVYRFKMLGEMHKLPCGLELCMSEPYGKSPKWYMTNRRRFIRLVDREDISAYSDYGMVMMFSDFGDAELVDRQALLLSNVTRSVDYFEELD